MGEPGLVNSFFPAVCIQTNTNLRADAIDELAVGLLARAVHAPQGRGDAPRGGRGARRGSGLGQCRATLEQEHEQQVDEPHRIQNATFVALREISAKLGRESVP